MAKLSTGIKPLIKPRFPRIEANGYTDGALKMDRLPLEITHIVFAQLKPREVALLRLACRAFAIIGAQYLLHQVHIIFKSSSFERLREISEHPIISQHVDYLYYEADTVQEFENMKEWKRNIVEPGWWERLPLETVYLPHADASDRENRAYQREMDKARGGPRYTYTDLQLRRAYEKYRKYLSNQKMMRSHDYESEIIRDAFNKMPNLKTLVMSMECCIGARSAKIERAFWKGLELSYGDDRQKELCGIPQLRSLLLAAENANLKLESLCCGNVHWRFLKHSSGTFEKMQRAVQFLHRMTLHIATRTEEDENDIPECHQFLDKYGRLRDLVTAAPDLKHLEIHFDDVEPFLPTTLKDIVGDFEWHALRSAIFSIIDADEGALVKFYGRHAGTLREIGLENIHLEVGGLWPRLLQCIRKMLPLEKVRIGGRLSTADGASYLLEGLEDDSTRSRTRVVIEDYLLTGGEGPLLDLESLF